jgi:hypothetical protein
MIRLHQHHVSVSEPITRPLMKSQDVLLDRLFYPLVIGLAFVSHTLNGLFRRSILVG